MTALIVQPLNCSLKAPGLNDVSRTIPAIGVCYWVGEAMGSTDSKDLKATPEMVSKTATMPASNAVHLAGLLKSETCPH